MEALETHLRAHPDLAEGWALLGRFFFAQGDPTLARSHTRRALSIREDVASFHQHMALYLHALQRPDSAIQSITRALELHPENAETRTQRGALWNLWGQCAHQQGDRAASVAHHARAHELVPDNLEFLSNLGLALTRSDDTADHERGFELLRGLRQQAPARVDFAHNLGHMLLVNQRLEEAAQVLSDVQTRWPTHEGAALDLAAIAMARTSDAAGVVVLDAYLQRVPHSANARFNRGLALLRQSRWAEGMRDFEARYQVSSIQTPRLKTPRLVTPDAASVLREDAITTDVQGARLLIIGEQGLGDTLQFIRFCSAMRARHGPANITCAVQPRLLPICVGVDGVDEFVSVKELLPEHDAWTAMMSLPLLSGSVEAGELDHPPCYAPAPSRRSRWSTALPPRRRCRAAIAWQGNPGYADDANRSIPLEFFVRLLEACPGLDLISLQAGHGCEQLEGLDGVAGLHVLPDDLDEDGAFLDSAAVIANCDLLISSDTALVHVAAGMGTATWMPTAFRPDWRWSAEGTATPWYPSMRLFRQPRPGAWAPVFTRIASALNESFP